MGKNWKSMGSIPTYFYYLGEPEHIRLEQTQKINTWTVTFSVVVFRYQYRPERR